MNYQLVKTYSRKSRILWNMLSDAAAFTIVRDEPVFLDLWHRHYSRAFASGNLHVLHHVASEAECATGPFADALAKFDPNNVTRLVNADFDPQWLGEVVALKQQSLLAAHAAVLFAEVDELLITDPEAPPLGEYLAAFVADGSSRAIRCHGFEIHHDLGSGEPAFDHSKPILSQRRRWHRNQLYDKTLLSKIVLHWSLGFHTCNEPATHDPNLVLVHLHKFDFQSYLDRHEERARFKHADSAVAQGWNTHYRKTGPALVAQYMQLPAVLEPVPGWVEAALPGI